MVKLYAHQVAILKQFCLIFIVRKDLIFYSYLYSYIFRLHNISGIQNKL